MTRGMLMLLVAATAMALLLAGCGSSQSEDQGSRQGSEQEGGSSQQAPEPTTDERVVVHCADSGSTGGQQEEAGRGDVSSGKIVFTRSTDVASDIYVVDEEGAHETKLTCTNKYEVDPIWSPDGQKIAYFTSPDGLLYVMNADGTNRISLGSRAGDVALGRGAPAWSPDGQKIAFVDSSGELKVINADGTTEARLTSLTTSFSGYEAKDRTALGSPAWSPEGKRIAFARCTVPDTSTVDSSASASAPAEGLTGIYLIKVDGTGLRKLTSIAGDQIFQENGGPVWSPDGEKIAYVLGTINGTINVINADGSGRRSRTNPPGMTDVAFPTWSPDGERIAFICPQSPRASTTDSVSQDLCVINADGTGLKRIATKVSTVGAWGRKQR